MVALHQHREEQIRRWFLMWLEGTDTGIDELFEPDCVYTESWGPEYTDRKTVKRWFREWNTRGKVLRWDIKQFFHNQGHTAVEWYFQYAMKDSPVEQFDGVTIVEWSEYGTIKELKEFGCKLKHYNPYQHGDIPLLKNEDMWT